MESQNAAIKKFLLRGNSLTSLQALRLFKSLRLASRINDLRKEGMKIETRMIPTKTGKRVASYSAILMDKLF